MYIVYFQKIERLKGSLHLLDAFDKPQNKHLVFVDSKKEGKLHRIVVSHHKYTVLSSW